MKRLLLFTAVINVVAVLHAAEIASHPRDLKYPALRYDPPRAADFRHKLATGGTAYLVEDHELPLVNVSVLVRTGRYLEPAEKAGLTSLVGSQMRAGGTKWPDWRVIGGGRWRLAGA